jgi:ribosome recycling factor
MEGAIDRLHSVLNGISAGRATPRLLAGVRVECYGGHLPINQVAVVGIHDRIITIQPFDREVAPAIEKAICESSLGLYPVRSTDIIRINVPPLSGERQEELVRHVGNVAEEQRVAIRNIRRDTLKNLDSIALTEDELKTAKADVGNLSKRYTQLVDTALAAKINDLRGGDRRWDVKDSKRRGR